MPECLNIRLGLDHVPQVRGVDGHQEYLDPFHLPLDPRHSIQMHRHAFLQFPRGSNVLGRVLSDVNLALDGVLGIDVRYRLPRIVQGALHFQSLLAHAVVAMQGFSGADVGEMPTHGKLEQVGSECCQPRRRILLRCEDNLAGVIHDLVQRETLEHCHQVGDEVLEEDA